MDINLEMGGSVIHDLCSLPEHSDHAGEPELPSSAPEVGTPHSKSHKHL